MRAMITIARSGAHLRIRFFSSSLAARHIHQPIPARGLAQMTSSSEPQQLAFRIAPSIAQTSRPPIPQAYAWAEAYAPTAARPLLDMSQGVPGIPPPQGLLDALGVAAADPESCGYVPNAGEPELRRAVAREMKTVYGQKADVGEEDVFITAGCNLAFTAAIMSVAGGGDEVILPVPWYFNHEMTLTMLGIKPVWLETSPIEGFLPSVAECEKLITPHTRAIVLVTPNNPTGAIYPPDLIASFASLASRHSLPLVIDETYRDFVTPGPPHHLFASPSWRNTLIHLFSFSKSYCIPGHRLGLVVASPALASALTTALDNIQICAPRPTQRALASLLPSLRPFVKANAAAIKARHGLFKVCLPRRWHIGSQGAYYAFVQHPFKEVDSVEVCRRLAQELGVVCLPAGFFTPGKGGSAMGRLSRWIRFSVANVDDEKVRKVCERLEECETTFGWELDE